MLIKRSVVLAKIQTDAAIPAVPTPANDAVLVEGLTYNFSNQKMAEQGDVSSPLINKKQSLFGGALFDVSFAVRLKGSGAAGTAPEWGALMQGCGFDETIVAITSVTYAPLSLGHKYITLYVYEDGFLFPINACQGSVSFEGEAGGNILAQFNFTGHVGTQTTAALPAPTLDDVQAPVLRGNSFTVGGASAILSKLSVAVENEISINPNVNSADGFADPVIISRSVSGSIDPLVAAGDINGFINDWQTNQVRAIDTGVIGSVAGNKLQIAMPETSYNDAGFEDANGQRKLGLPFMAHDQAGDDSISLVVT